MFGKRKLTDAAIQAWRRDLQARLATILQHPEQSVVFLKEQIALARHELFPHARITSLGLN